MNTIEQELLHVIRALTVILSSGIGLEMALKKIAEGDYGDISSEFRKVLDNTAMNGNLENGLQRLKVKSKSSGFRKLLSILIRGLRGNINVIESLDRLAEREIQERAVETEKFVDLLGTRAEVFMTMGILVPIFIMILVFVNELMDGPLTRGIPITPRITMVIFAGVLLILLQLVITTKMKEPTIG